MVMEDLASAVPGSSDSLSHHSEPPNIRNWFSSYVYESFPLDTSDYLKDSLDKENECTKDGFSVEKSNTENGEETTGENNCTNDCGAEKDHKHENDSKRKIVDYELSVSLPSESPDIRNWFSSYVYESPVLDTSDGLIVSQSRDDEWEKGYRERNDEEGKNWEEQRQWEISDQQAVAQNSCSGGSTQRNASPWSMNHEAECSAKVLDSSEALLSEPPDVRNWFSSYVYESPVLGDIDKFGFCSSEKDELVIEESDTEEANFGIIRKARSRYEVVAVDKLNSDGYKKDILENEDTKSSKEEEIRVSPVDIHFKNLEYNSLARTSSSSTKEVPEPSLNHETLQCKPKQERGDMHFEQNLMQESGLSNEDSLCKPKQERGDMHFEQNLMQESGLSNEDSLCKPKQESFQETVNSITNGCKYPEEKTHGNNKENAQRTKVAENGFVTTKKDRCKEAKERNSIRKPQGILVECSGNNGSVGLTGEEEDDFVKRRKVLAEMTNIQRPGLVEVAGKWLCPQKNKPDRGPQFKQLCLDRWIHKVGLRRDPS